MDDRELVAELYRTPPAEFVAARNEKVAELKRAGQKELAAEIAKLRRHSPAHWALDVLANSQGDLVAAWADTADRVREAQRAAIEGREGEDLREVLAELRRHTTDLTAAAPKGAPKGELPSVLAAVAASDEATAELRAGLLGAGLPPDDSIFGSVVDVPPRRARPKKAAVQKQATATRGRVAADESAAPAEDPKLRRQFDEATVAAEDAAADVSAAEETAASAVDEAGTAEADVEAANEAVEAARAALADAEAALRAARQRAAATHKARTAAATRLERARTASDRAAARLAAVRKTLGG